MTRPYAGKESRKDWEAQAGFSINYPRQAELLSYLQGLAPVGEPFEFRRHQVVADLGFGTIRSIYLRLRPLFKKGFVARRESEFFPKRQALVVLKRLEEIEAA